MIDFEVKMDWPEEYLHSKMLNNFNYLYGRVNSGCEADVILNVEFNVKTPCTIEVFTRVSNPIRDEYEF